MPIISQYKAGEVQFEPGNHSVPLSPYPINAHLFRGVSERFTLCLTLCLRIVYFWIILLHSQWALFHFTDEEAETTECM